MKSVIISLLFFALTLCANAKDHEGIVTENLNAGGFALISRSQPVNLIVADSDKKGILIAARNLQKDFERVCGRQAQLLSTPTASIKRYVIAGSLESPYIKQMVKTKKGSVSPSVSEAGSLKPVTSDDDTKLINLFYNFEV